jgi:hypothetical protein
MRTVMIKIIVKDEKTKQEVIGDITLDQVITLNEVDVNFIEAILPQLNRELTTLVGSHEEITRNKDEGKPFNFKGEW